MNFFVPKKSCPPPYLNPVSAPAYSLQHISYSSYFSFSLQHISYSTYFSFSLQQLLSSYFSYSLQHISYYSYFSFSLQHISYYSYFSFSLQHISDYSYFSVFNSIFSFFIPDVNINQDFNNYLLKTETEARN